MFGDLLHHAGRVIYPLLERFSREAWYSAPRPPDARAVARGVGHDPDRVLLTGASAAVGWGVISHELGLAGHLARGTSVVTQRGVDLEVFAHPRLDIAGIIDELTPQHISRYDAIVLTIGMRETLELIPPRRWRDHLTELLDHITAGRSSAPVVLVVGVPEDLPESIGRVARSFIRRRARGINATTRRVITGRDRVAYCAPAPVSSAEGFDADATYDRVARGIIPLLADALNHAPDRVRKPVDEDARLATVESLQTIEVRDDPRIRQLLTTARDTLDVHSVDFFFVGRDEVRLLAATIESQLVAPRESSLSTVVLEHPHGLVIPDLTLDPAHASRPQVVGSPFLRFYAGFPVESPDGHPVGVLAVVDTKPRQLTHAELSLLRSFALRAGVLLFDR